MRIPRLLAPLTGALALCAILGTSVLVPGTARAADDSLAATPVTDGAALCVTGAPTFDDVVTAAATAVRTLVPPEQVAGYDRQVADFRATLAAVRVHRDGLPMHPAAVGERPDFLDDPIVTYVVNGLDAVRTGRIHETMSVSHLTVNDAIEVFVLATRIVKIPAQLVASMVPTVGFFLKPIVGAMFNGVKAVSRKVQEFIAANCAAPNAYPRLELDEYPIERVELPAPLIDLANALVRADGTCTPLAELTTAALVERTRTYLDTAGLPLDRPAMHAAADAMQAFLSENRVAELALLRRTEELGPLVHALDYGPLTFLTNLGFSLYEGRALNTVPLAEIRVEHALDLATLTLDITGLLLTAGNMALGFTGVASSVTTPLSIIQTLAFAPTTYGTPILKGVMQSMCAA
ncbi:hypothetical protein [Nocardia lijiangensis]|uniref:hypothetical protein n=1 Tax=Nocardia lijiangensis TaxID=299618 RepID=UPI00082C9880|nr:hypothetical protein [Nocardia lijiangensis]